MMNEAAYTATADELTQRIIALFPTHPELLESRERDPWTLFDAGLKCDDLQPSLFQANWALAKARELHEDASQPEEDET